MNILIFTNRDLASNYNLNVLLPYIYKDVRHIFVSDKVGGKSVTPPQALRELKFYEQTLVNDILFPQLEAQSKKHRKGNKLLTFKELSKKYKIPITSLNDIKSTESLELIKSMHPDLVLSVRYGKIFGNDFLAIPKQGVINLHSGILPNYRGVLATFRALMNEDSEIGCTLHYIDDKTIDTGGVIGFSKIKTDKDKSLLEHILSLYPAATDLIVSTINKIKKGQIPAILPQNEADAQYFTFPTQAEVDDFIKKGWQFVDVGFYSDFIKKYL